MRWLRRASRRCSAALAWTPEWPIALCIAIAWLMLVVGGSGGSEHAAHTGTGTWSAFLQAAGGWALMSFAMMMPVALPAIRHVSLNSLRVRRRRAVALYVGSYLLVWLLVGVAAAVIVVAATAGGVTVPQLLVLTLATAALWQLTRAKRRAILACRRTVPLPPMGRRADVACVRFAFVQGMRCATSCWPLMLLMAVAPHTLTLMLVATLIVVAEERLSVRHRLIRPLAAVFAVAAIAAIWVSLNFDFRMTAPDPEQSTFGCQAIGGAYVCTYNVGPTRIEQRDEMERASGF